MQKSFRWTAIRAYNNIYRAFLHEKTEIKNNIPKIIFKKFLVGVIYTFH